MQAMRSSVPGWDGLRATLVDVSAGSHARPTGSSDPGHRRRRSGCSRRSPRRPRGRLWRIGTPLVVLALRRPLRGQRQQQRGHRPAAGPLHRPGLAGRGRGRRATPSCATGSPALDAQVTMLSTAVERPRRQPLPAQDRAAPATPPASTPRRGPGVTITLSDAPEDVINSTTGDVNPLLVHQQDIQAVVNALWKGGASAVTIQGQRVVSTTGIKCEGNSVQLQGVPYPQPYVIQAVGDQGALLTRRRGRRLRRRPTASDAADPEISVGWDLDARGRGHRAGVRRPARPQLRRPRSPSEPS